VCVSSKARRGSSGLHESRDETQLTEKERELMEKDAEVTTHQQLTPTHRDVDGNWGGALYQGTLLGATGQAACFLIVSKSSSAAGLVSERWQFLLPPKESTPPQRSANKSSKITMYLIKNASASGGLCPPHPLPELCP